MADKAAYVKFFTSRPGPDKYPDPAGKLADEFISKGISLDYARDAFTFFTSRPGPDKYPDPALALTQQWHAHKLGPIPIKPFGEVLYKFFTSRPGPDKYPDQALALIVKFYEMTESNGWLPSFDELISDVPTFYKFFTSRPGPDKYPDQALALCERIVKGVGRVNFSSFKKSYDDAVASGKYPDAALGVAFAAAGV
eukprot:TRINITY_DN71_c0_g1_i1.p1 TRINITY_DN71_c0_g1~~TRINITY_DN71_c0_g1_i1.p1  ORF type:complete len:207 (-),score=45.17 TRINITY_DN71_c0_g1_i1:61-648(-)